MNVSVRSPDRLTILPQREPLLSVRDLVVTLVTDDGPAHAVRGVSFDVHEREFLAVVGESGSGKSVTFLAVLGLLASMVPCEVAGRVSLAGQDLAAASKEELRRIRGRSLSMIFQDPFSALNPVLQIGDQIADVVQAHEAGLSRADAVRRAVEALEMVRIPGAASRVRDYPYRFSGGMRQRVLIAMAIVCRPRLLIADEPTTAIDVTIQAQILALLDSLRRELSMAMVLITHDLGIVAQHADRVAVMYAGRIIEEAGVTKIFAAPAHPYTRALLHALPRFAARSARLTSIAGEPPAIHRQVSGCAFEPRCGRTQGRSICRKAPALVPVDELHRAACHFPNEAEQEAEAAVTAAPANHRMAMASPFMAQDGALLRVEGLVKQFVVRRHRGRTPAVLHAVNDVSFDIAAGETLGIVGESGSGKSTMARCVLRLIDASAGRIVFEGRDVTGFGRRDLRGLRDRMQIMFQDSRSALNPRMTVEAIVGEPLVIRGLWRRGGRERVRDTLARVGLSAHQATRYPHEFSGGQQQRIGLARAVILNPALLVLDEPVSSLDVSIRAQIINLLEDLQGELGLSYLFIAHDLSVVHHISDRIAVMYLGRIVEIGDADAVCLHPLHPYTRVLVAAVPEPDPTLAHVDGPPVQVGDAPDPIDPPTGCPFHRRCAHAEAVGAARALETIDIAGRRLPLACVTQRPSLAQANGRWVACHFTAELA